MRSLPVSATASIPGCATPGGNGGAKLTEFGRKNSPALSPRPPDFSSNVPLEWSAWILLLPVSATTMRSPSGE